MCIAVGVGLFISAYACSHADRSELTGPGSHCYCSAGERVRSKGGFFACDGLPKTGSDDVRHVREIMAESSWNCPKRVFFSVQHHGPDLFLPQAIDWFFQNVEAGIVSEDDCVPEPAFFGSAEVFLDSYQTSPAIWGYTGSNPAGIELSDGAPIGFVRTALTWGWATWASRWQQYRDLRGDRVNDWSSEGGCDPWERPAFHWYVRVRRHRPMPWDYHLAITVIRLGGLWGVPRINQVTNIGFGSDATSTKKRPRSHIHWDASILRPSAISKEDLSDRPGRDTAMQRRLHEVHHRVMRPLWLNFFRDRYRWLRLYLRAPLEPR